MLWRIALRDDILAKLFTDPSAYWAHTDTELDWYLRTRLTRPREDYVVEQVPGPTDRAVTDEMARRQRIRAQTQRDLAERRAKHGMP